MSREERDPVSERLARIESDVSSLKSDVVLLKNDVSSLKSDVSSLKNDVAWLKHLYKSLDYRVWFILAGVIVTILVSLLR
jgi:predicted nuclease with TOPRIM domain